MIRVSISVCHRLVGTQIIRRQLPRDTMAALSPFISKEWLLEDPKASMEHVERMLKSATLSTAYASIFSKRLMVMLVYISNKLERTLPPRAAEDEIYKYLDDVFDSIDADGCLVPAAEQWDAEGEQANGTKCPKVQLLQHLRSLKFLFSGLPVASGLTVRAVLQAHGILMNGAVDEEKKPVAAGAFRDHPCHAGAHAYPDGDPAMLERSLQRILDEFNAEAAAPDGTVVTKLQASTKLFYDVITLHPFQNGNGRLCRILLAFAMAKLGFPFPVPLTTGHKSARKHYMKAILLARRGDMRELNTTALMSVEYVLCNFMENVRLAA